MKITYNKNEAPKQTEKEAQRLVCVKLNELVGMSGFFSISNDYELIASQCANQTFTVAFGLVAAVMDKSGSPGYFCFGYKQAAIVFKSNSWNDCHNELKLLSNNTSITISND